MTESIEDRLAEIPAGSVFLEGILSTPAGAKGLIVFSHGSGSSRHSPRNQFVARELQRAGHATLLFDLLTREEDAVYETRFDIDLLTRRLAAATLWLFEQPLTESLRLGYFGASTGAASALNAAATLGDRVGAVVSRGGRPDLASNLPAVTAPTLLIVGGRDDVVIELNRRAYDEIQAEKKLVIVPGATHLFEEPGALKEVARLAVQWFDERLIAAAP